MQQLSSSEVNSEKEEKISLNNYRYYYISNYIAIAKALASAGFIYASIVFASKGAVGVKLITLVVLILFSACAAVLQLLTEPLFAENVPATRSSHYMLPAVVLASIASTIFALQYEVTSPECIAIICAPLLVLEGAATIENGITFLSSICSFLKDKKNEVDIDQPPRPGVR